MNAPRESRHDGFDFDRLRIDDVSRHFGRRRALSHVSLECAPGKIVGLLGPNGCGKSTLLAIASTLLPASTGQVLYGSSTPDAAGGLLRSRIGLLGHDLWLYPELTARENLLFFAQLYRLPDPATLVASALDRARLASRGHELVHAFSRGMKQRLALERALLHDPRLVLLDEPFTGLDDASAEALEARLAELRQAGRIVLMATHDLEAASRLLDEAAILRDGRLIAVETDRASLRDRYREHVGAGA